MSAKYDVALSYTYNDQAIAREIAESLKKENLSVFFDEHVSAKLWGRDLFDYLNKVYSDSKVCIVLLSKSYSESQWTHNELRNLLAHSINRPSFSILPLHIGDAPIPKGLTHFAYVEWRNTSSQELAQMVKERIASLVPLNPETQQENIHVIRREFEWSVKRGGTSRASSVHKTREEAITSALELARRSKQATVVVHSADGSVESQVQVSKE